MANSPLLTPTTPNANAMSSIVEIFVAGERGSPMRPVNQVEAFAECGLAGDRYTNAKNRKAPDYQVTLIELENIEAFTRLTGFALPTDAPRRNIVTLGVRLNELCGKRFNIGKAEFEGLELCEPCALFAERTHREVIKWFVGKGGLRARIVVGGTIRVGQPIEVRTAP